MEGEEVRQILNNSNRIAATNSAGSLTSQDVDIDNQDRLLRYGSREYSYTANGELTRILDTATLDETVFDYDVAGNLLGIDLPNGDRLGYIIDGRDRRVGKLRNGVVERGFLYGNQLNIIAELDGNGQVVSRFVYAQGRHVPAYMERQGTVYRFVVDQLGSVLAVVDADTGAAVQRLEYDSWGRVLSDTNPGFQPFGFAGGLWDRDVGLVRFGARDYDPEPGRWTSKDPILFNGGDMNLYGYVLGDPINFLDLNGRNPAGAIAGAAALAGLGWGGWQLWLLFDNLFDIHDANDDVNRIKEQQVEDIQDNKFDPDLDDALDDAKRRFRDEGCRLSETAPPIVSPPGFGVGPLKRLCKFLLLC